MTWDKIKGSWKELHGTVREQWGKLTDDDLTVIAGHRDRLVGAIQRQYGSTRADIETEVSAFEQKLAAKFRAAADKLSPPEDKS